MGLEKMVNNCQNRYGDFTDTYNHHSLAGLNWNKSGIESIVSAHWNGYSINEGSSQHEK